MNSEHSTTGGRVCIIGAGSSGLVAAKVLDERGIPFDCFELGSDIGGLWRYNNDSGLSAAYRSLHINTSRDKMAFSGFPMPREYPDFPHHSQILEYFERYADHFGLRRHITFCTAVRRVEPVGDGSYDVETESRSGQRRCRRYSAVLVASGHHWDPKLPEFPGSFAGQAIHSHQYKTPAGLEDKNVLVVGLGNSGCDIACEVSRVARKTYLSTRRGGHIIPKYLFGRPLDRVVPGWVWRHAPLWLFQWLFGAALRLSRGAIERYGLPKPPHRILEEHPTISSDLLNLIGHGRIHIKPNVSELAGDQVRFADGSAEPIDAIVYATGYNITFPFLGQEVIDAQDNRVSLYKRVVHPDRANLYFIGLVQPWGALMPLAERQAEWVGDLLAGEAALPNRDEMLRDIDRAAASVRRRYVDSTRHTIQVDFYPYLDDLDRERVAGRKRLPPVIEPTAAPPVPLAAQPFPLCRAA